MSPVQINLVLPKGSISKDTNLSAKKAVRRGYPMGPGDSEFIRLPAIFAENRDW
ncbi:MAG: hypothetical protein CM1200mP18_22800 [Gammaproteobacteria bacterium]|nr:MAG: hypothetical protein CM1200mP18_22800 [Gammaproteobacteria bacterium]